MDCQNILDILLGSLLDHPEECGAENEMRYKLIIDSSEDGSLVRLLFSTGVLERGKTRVYMCSDFPGDAQLQKVNIWDCHFCLVRIERFLLPVCNSCGCCGRSL
jgi:hypothetical protein